MKKVKFIIVITILAFSIVYAYAQNGELTIRGETHLATQYGSVRIGTTTPAQRLTINGDIDMLKGQTSTIYSLGEMSFDWTTGGTYDHPHYHGIQCKNESGTWSPSLRINSFNDMIFTIDSNNNNADSYFKVQHHSQTNGTDIFWVRSSGDSNYNGNAYFRGSLAIGTTTTSRKLHVNGDGYVPTRVDVLGRTAVGGTLAGHPTGVFGKGWYGVIGHGTDPLNGAGVAGVLTIMTDPASPCAPAYGQGPTRGIHGLATGGGGDGVRGEATTSNGIGVYAYNSATSGESMALLARTNSTTNGWAATFYGRVRCNRSAPWAPPAPSPPKAWMYPFDIAEKINIRDCEEGDVVVADPENNETVIKSSKPYQNSVIGIISTNPMFYIDSADIKDGKPLALAGRVPCNATTENGPIKRGDILVTSSRPGYAMKADLDRLNPGAMVGKALEPLEKNEGKILVLVE